MPLKIIDENDLPLIFSWRNHPKVRENMYSTHEITWEEHKSWFEKVKIDPTIKYFLYMDNHLPLGVINFTQFYPARGNAFWGFYAGADSPKGTGIKMEYEALEYAFNVLNLHKLNCEVIYFNQAVINLHRKSGFMEEGLFRDFHYDGKAYHHVVRLGILKNEWLAIKDLIRARITDIEKK